MKYIYCFIIALIAFNAAARRSGPQFFRADDRHINYIGRVDLSDPARPRFWSPGVYVQAKFEGPPLEIFLNDERDGHNYNYIEVAIDGNTPVRIKLNQKENHLVVANNLPAGEHVV